MAVGAWAGVVGGGVAVGSKLGAGVGVGDAVGTGVGDGAGVGTAGTGVAVAATAGTGEGLGAGTGVSPTAGAVVAVGLGVTVGGGTGLGRDTGWFVAAAGGVAVGGSAAIGEGGGVVAPVWTPANTTVAASSEFEPRGRIPEANNAPAAIPATATTNKMISRREGPRYAPPSSAIPGDYKPATHGTPTQARFWRVPAVSCVAEDWLAGLCVSV